MRSPMPVPWGGYIGLGPYGDAPRKTGSLYLRAAHDLPNSVGQLVVRQDVYSQSYF
jgi:hypothetical protein